MQKNNFRLLLKTSKNYLIPIFLGLLLALNYSGFCFKEFRFLSDEEQINIAVQYVLNRYPKKGDVTFYYLPGNREGERKLAWPEDPVPYKDMEEFFLVNPSCCKVGREYQSLGGRDSISFWGCVTGTETAIVGVRYLLRYKDGSGVIQSELKEVFPKISNCGKLHWESD